MKQNNYQDAALLVMDVQNGIVSRLNDDNSMMDNLKEVVKVARKNGVPVLYVRVSFREGYPEVSANNQTFARIKESGAGFDDGNATAIHASVAPQQSDVIITKKRVSAFTGSDLEMVLRSMNINHLILTGIATSGVVLSTVREAADKDYRITILSDCCADRDEEVHRVLMNKVFPQQAKVIESDKWKELL